VATYKFTGKVIPVTMDVTLKGATSAHWEDASLGLVLDVAVSITHSVLEIICESNLYGTNAIDGEVHLRALDTARGIVDVIGYAKGLGAGIILETAIKPDGVNYNIQVERPDLAALVTAFQPGPEEKSVDLAGMLQIVFSDPLVFMALNDLVTSIALPHHAPVNCGRAIEAIRELMTPVNGDKKQGWVAMRKDLNISQDYLSFITDQSKAPRHGDRKGITYAAFQETVRRSWIVMNRFLEYRKRGSRPLPLADFSLLSIHPSARGVLSSSTCVISQYITSPQDRSSGVSTKIR
jgi:hypothetical protein